MRTQKPIYVPNKKYYVMFRSLFLDLAWISDISRPVLYGFHKAPAKVQLLDWRCGLNSLRQCRVLMAFPPLQKNKWTQNKGYILWAMAPTVSPIQLNPLTTTLDKELYWGTTYLTLIFHVHPSPCNGMKQHFVPEPLNLCTYHWLLDGVSVYTSLNS